MFHRYPQQQRQEEQSQPRPAGRPVVSHRRRAPAEHPLPAIRVIADGALRRMNRVIGAVHADRGQLWVPPEPLLNSTLLTVQYSVHSTRLFCEMLGCKLLFAGS